MISQADLRELATLEPGEAVLSVHCRTDPRDPVNRGTPPGWVVALNNGLREWSARLEREDAPREQRLALRDLAERVPERLRGLDGHERGRSVSLFVAPGGSLDRLLTWQLPLRADLVAWGSRPVIWPLAEVAERGERTGLILVSSERVRLLSWEQGHVSEPEPSTYDLELGDWRPYEAYAAANPARGQQTATHQESFASRVGEWRRRFLDETAAAISRRLEELGWERVVVSGDPELCRELAGALPEPLRERVVGELALNLIEQPVAEVAEQVEPELFALKRRERAALAAEVVERSQAGGRGALGPDETLTALGEGRVERLILDPEGLAAGSLGPQARAALDGAGDGMLSEQAVRLALETAAAVTFLEPEDGTAIAAAGGIAALLRY